MKKLFTIIALVFTTSLFGQAESTVLFDGQIVYEATEKPAQFVGGDEAKIIFLKDNLHAPEQEEFQESLHATFIIDTTGSIRNISITNQRYSDGLTPLETEFIRVINRMPKWIPAEQNGKKVCSRVRLPLKITFK
jgi:protein TonB